MSIENYKIENIPSWEIVNKNVVRKAYDRSLFKNNGFEIPEDIRWFFNIDKLNIGQKRTINIIYDGVEYEAYIQRKSVVPIRSKMYWSSQLTEILKSFSNDGQQHKLEFQLYEKNRYNVKIINTNSSHRAWLITYNKSKWHWDNFIEKCKDTKRGIPCVESWACANTNPQIGDEVFLLKLGEQPRGLIGHGTVVRTTYEKKHYDEIKATEGKKEKAIDVEFDRLIDYMQERYVPQEELVRKCGLQHWSPQNSGIEIKPEVLPALRSLWHSVTDINDNEGYWPSPEEYPVSLTKEDWKRFIKEIEFPSHKGCMRVLACFIDIGGVASPKVLSVRYKGHPTVYTSSVLNTSKRALDYFKMKPCPDGETQRYFPIAFCGRHGSDISPGTYEYRMRPELFEALKEIDLSEIDLLYDKGDDEMYDVNFSHNMILYGPPGTGKTYNSVNYAVAICEGKSIESISKEPYSEVFSRYRELTDSGRIAFTTFHQSYGYEEFIEGIKPKLDMENESLGYVIEDGVFKDFCRKAHTFNVKTTGSMKIKDHPRIWAMILGGPGMTSLKAECFDKSEVRIGWSEVEDGQWEDDEELSWRAKQMLHAFTYEMEPGDVVFIEKSSQSIDAIGVVAGEYEYDNTLGEYPRKRKVEWIAKNIDEDMVQYLPRGKKQLARFTVYSLDYLGTEILSEILKKYIDEDEYNPVPEAKPYVFIIDEINRGNISKIFGELITLIEDTKRAGNPEAMEAILPYSGETFSVPNNVYILGTMNTADRSIALMDTALRRRFKFIEMMPNSEVLDSLGVGTIAVGGGELNVARMLNIINERIEYLFDREHTIGHAFFTRLADDLSLETLADIFEKNVIPLLQEYFYEDYEKIQLILGDNSKEDEYKFILDHTVKVKDIFNGNPDIDLPEKGYSVQHEAFLKLESYKQIGKGL